MGASGSIEIASSTSSSLHPTRYSVTAADFITVVDGANQAAALELFLEGQVESTYLTAKKGGMPLSRDVVRMVLVRMEQQRLDEDASSPGARQKRLVANWERYQRDLTPEEEEAKVCAYAPRNPKLCVGFTLQGSGIRLGVPLLTLISYLPKKERIYRLS